MSDLQALTVSGGAAALDIPFDLVHDACSDVSVRRAPSPPPSPSEALTGATVDDSGSSSMRPKESGDEDNSRAGGNLQGATDEGATNDGVTDEGATDKGTADEGATDERIGGDLGRPSSKIDADGTTQITREEEGSSSCVGATTTRVLESENTDDAVGGVKNYEPDGGGENSDGGGGGSAARPVSVEGSDRPAEGDTSTTSFARNNGSTTTPLVDTEAANSGGDAHLNKTTPAIAIAGGDIDPRGGVAGAEQLQAPAVETGLSVEGSSLVRSPSDIHRDGLLELGATSSADDVKRRRSAEEARPEEDSDSDVSYDLDDDLEDEDSPLSSPTTSASRGELSHKDEPLRDKGAEERDDDGSSSAGTVLGSPPPSPPSGAVEPEAIPVDVDKVDEDDDFKCSSSSNSDNANIASARSSRSETGGEVMSLSTSGSSSRSIGELSSSSSRVPVPDSPDKDSDQDAAPSLPAQSVPPAGSDTQQPKESPSDTEQPKEPPSDTRQPEESPTTDSASLDDDYSVGSTSVSAGSVSEPEPDSVDSPRDDEGAQHALNRNTDDTATLVPEVETAVPPRIITEPGGPEPPPNEEKEEEDHEVAASTDQKHDSSSGTHCLSTHPDGDVAIEPSSTIMESSTTTTSSRPIDLPQATSPSAEEPPEIVADARSSNTGNNGDGKPDGLEAKHQEVDPEALTADDDHVVAGVVSDEGSALTPTRDTEQPDAVGPVAEDAYKPDFEGINTEVDVGGLHARFSKVLAGAVSDEAGSALPLTHSTEPDTAVGPVAEDVNRPGFDEIDTAVDVGGLQARFSSVLASAVSDEGSAVPLTHSTEPDTVEPVVGSGHQPEVEGVGSEVDVDGLQACSSNVDTGPLANEVAVPPPTHDVGPDTAVGPFEEDAYNPDFEGIDTAVDVDGLQAQSSIVDIGAVAEEVPAQPGTHTAETDTTARPVAGDAYKPDFEGIDIAVDVDDLQARFSRMLGSYSDVPDDPAAPLSAQDAAAAPPADQSLVSSPEAPDTLSVENGEESVLQSQPWAANLGGSDEIDPDTPPLKNEEVPNPQPQPWAPDSGNGAENTNPEVGHKVRLDKGRGCELGRVHMLLRSESLLLLIHCRWQSELETSDTR